MKKYRRKRWKSVDSTHIFIQFASELQCCCDDISVVPQDISVKATHREAALRTLISVCLSVRLSHLFDNVPVIVSSWNFQELLPLANTISMQKVKVRGQRPRSQRSWPHLAISGPLLQFEFTYGDEMMHKAWCCLEEVPYCSSRSSVKFQGRAAKWIVDFDPNWAFPDCNSSLNSPLAMKWCTKVEAILERCPIVFQGHTSIFKVTQDKKIANFLPDLSVSRL